MRCLGVNLFINYKTLHLEIIINIKTRAIIHIQSGAYFESVWQINMYMFSFK